MSFLNAVLRSSLEQSIQKIKRDPTYQLDPALSARALWVIAMVRLLSLVRSWRWYFFLRKAKTPFFVGRRVTIRHADYLSLGRGVTLEDYVYINSLSREGIILGNNVSIGAFTIIEVTGILSHLGKGLRIGHNSNLGDYCYVGAAGGIEIGQNVLVGQRVSFHSENHNFARTDIPIKLQGTTHQGITVGDDCWIGTGAIILDGVTIGGGSVVAAGSVVTRNVPPYSVVGGVPAKIIQSRQAKDT